MTRAQALGSQAGGAEARGAAKAKTGAAKAKTGKTGAVACRAQRHSQTHRPMSADWPSVRHSTRPEMNIARPGGRARWCHSRRRSAAAEAGRAAASEQRAQQRRLGASVCALQLGSIHEKHAMAGRRAACVFHKSAEGCRAGSASRRTRQQEADGQVDRAVGDLLRRVDHGARSQQRRCVPRMPRPAGWGCGGGRQRHGRRRKAGGRERCGGRQRQRRAGFASLAAAASAS